VVDRVNINIYCDESCHLKNDGNDIMVLGALSCPKDKKYEVYQDIRKIKQKHNINSKLEVKWVKISNPKIELFEDLIEYFFNNEFLSFRAVVVKNKKLLDHEKYNNGDYDLWYYKMYYLLLDKCCYPDNEYRIFIDIKDTNGGPRLKTLRKVLCNNKYDFMGDIIQDIEQVNSDRADLLQITDIFTGALSYYHRGLYDDPEKSNLKKRIIKKVISYIGEDIKVGTCKTEKKFNIFIWEPRGI
jgi:hypothetical protein